MAVTCILEHLIQGRLNFLPDSIPIRFYHHTSTNCRIFWPGRPWSQGHCTIVNNFPFLVGKSFAIYWVWYNICCFSGFIYWYKSNKIIAILKNFNPSKIQKENIIWKNQSSSASSSSPFWSVANHHKKQTGYTYDDVYSNRDDLTKITSKPKIQNEDLSAFAFGCFGRQFIQTVPCLCHFNGRLQQQFLFRPGLKDSMIRIRDWTITANIITDLQIPLRRPGGSSPNVNLYSVTPGVLFGIHPSHLVLDTDGEISVSAILFMVLSLLLGLPILLLSLL